MDRTPSRLRRLLVNVTTATHLGHQLAPVDAALVVRAQVALTTGAPLSATAWCMLERMERECQAHTSLTLVTVDAA